jgi:adenylate cyclase
MTDFLAFIIRFASDGIIGEMDAVYMWWATREPDGFRDCQIATLQRLAPYLALAIKSVSLVRMTGTLMETYLGCDPGRRVLSGRMCAVLPSGSMPSFGSAICGDLRALLTLRRNRSSRC